jgi:diamine N-acetyltransferase
MSRVDLLEVDRRNLSAVLRLSVAPDQAGFVAPNAVSLAEAYVTPSAWPRVIAIDGAPRGFLMVDREPDLPASWGFPTRTAYLWRLMVDHGAQGRGVGRAAVGVLCAALAVDGFAALATSFVPGGGDPGGFYARLGFADTGVVDEGERVLLRTFDGG